MRGGRGGGILQRALRSVALEESRKQKLRPQLVVGGISQCRCLRTNDEKHQNAIWERMSDDIIPSIVGRLFAMHGGSYGEVGKGFSTRGRGAGRNDDTAVEESRGQEIDVRTTFPIRMGFRSASQSSFTVFWVSRANALHTFAMEQSPIWSCGRQNFRKVTWRIFARPRRDLIMSRWF